MTSRNCWHRSLRTPGREQSCTTACARCVSAANSSPSLKNIRRDIPKMPRRFVSVTVSRLRSQEPQGRVPVPRKPHCHRCHRHRCHRWREPLVHTRQPRFYGVIVGVGNGGGSVVCCDFSHCSSSRMCGGVAWNWSVSLQGAGGRWRGSAQRAGQREFFLW